MLVKSWVNQVVFVVNQVKSWSPFGTRQRIYVCIMLIGHANASVHQMLYCQVVICEEREEKSALQIQQQSDWVGKVQPVQEWSTPGFLSSPHHRSSEMQRWPIPIIVMHVKKTLTSSRLVWKKHSKQKIEQVKRESRTGDGETRGHSVAVPPSQPDM